MSTPSERPSPADVQAAMAGLPRLRDDLAWSQYAEGASEAGNLVWVHAIVAEGSASTPEHLLLFKGRTYLGTATQEPRPYTRVLSTNGDTITVEYCWIVGDEPSAAPAGVGTVRYQLTDEGTVTALDKAPWPTTPPVSY